MDILAVSPRSAFVNIFPPLPKKLFFFSGGGNCDCGVGDRWLKGVLDAWAMMLSWLRGAMFSGTVSLFRRRENGLRFLAWPFSSSETLISDTSSPVGVAR